MMMVGGHTLEPNSNFMKCLQIIPESEKIPIERHPSDTDEDTMAYIDRKYKEQFKEEQRPRKHKVNEKDVCYVTHDTNSNSVKLYEQLISNMERHILFLRDEIVRKDKIIEKLIDKSCVHLGNQKESIEGQKSLKKAQKNPNQNKQNSSEFFRHL